uniref:Uncharacterized protein n=1 Tax=Anguilla anguilla TaxID=7936 RepID=A0A0E9XGB5_ANGAN
MKTQVILAFFLCGFISLVLLPWIRGCIRPSVPGLANWCILNSIMTSLPTCDVLRTMWISLFCSPPLWITSCTSIMSVAQSLFNKLLL